MSLLQGLFQRKLSALLGVQVTFDKVHVSLRGGSLDVRGMTVAGQDANCPVLTVKRVRAEFALTRALTRALAGEIVIKSLTVERPVVSVIRWADGTTNLPRAPQPDGAEATPARRDPARHAGNGRHPPRGGCEAGDVDENRSWRVDARHILLVDGEVHFRDEAAAGGQDVPSDAGGAAGGGGYHLSAAPVLAEVKHAADQFEVTLIIDSVGRRDVPAELGQVKAIGRLTNVADLTQLAAAGLDAMFEVGESLRIAVKGASIRDRSGEATIDGAVDLAALTPLLPPNLPALAALRAMGAQGRIDLTARASYAPADGLRVPELSLRASDVAVNPGQRANGRNAE